MAENNDSCPKEHGLDKPAKVCDASCFKELWGAGNGDYFAAASRTEKTCILPELSIDFCGSAPVSSGFRAAAESNLGLVGKEQVLSRITPTCKAGEKGSQISDSADIGERTEHLRNPENRLDVDLKKIWNPENRVLAIGDQHLALGIKVDVIDRMAEFKAAGASAIGMELFAPSSQEKLDAYLKMHQDNASKEEKENARAEIMNLLNSSQAPKGSDPKEAPAAVEYTMRIIDAAARNGLRILAIEPEIDRSFAEDGGYDLVHAGLERLPAELQGDFASLVDKSSGQKERDAAELRIRSGLEGWEQSDEFLRTLKQARDSGFDFGDMKVPFPKESQDRDWNRRLHDLRNQTWAERAAKYLDESPGSRLLLFAGAQHFQYGRRDERQIDSVNELLKQKFNVGTTVFQYAGADFHNEAVYDREMDDASEFTARQQGLQPLSDGKWPAAADNYQSAALRYTKPAASAGVSFEKFAIALKPDARREADYIIHLPSRKVN